MQDWFRYLEVKTLFYGLINRVLQDTVSQTAVLVEIIMMCYYKILVCGVQN